MTAAGVNRCDGSMLMIEPRPDAVGAGVAAGVADTTGAVAVDVAVGK